jgi:two-component system, LuxR family, response regulator FixJ
LAKPVLMLARQRGISRTPDIAAQGEGAIATSHHSNGALAERPINGQIAMSHRRLVHIVDDEVRVRDSLALLLSTAQIETRTYASAEDYLASVQWDEPACVVLDNQLPGLSGIDLLKRIGESASDTAVIMITGYADVPTAVAAMRAGAYHFVQKPIDAEALLILIEEALARSDKVLDHKAEAQAIKSRCALLTQREREVFELLVEGLPTKLIAYRLGISARTVEHHRAAVMHKMQARTISHLVRMALSFGPAAGSRGGEK